MTSAEFPASILMPADPTNYYADAMGPASVQRIIIHCTDGHAIAANTAKMWQVPYHGSSAHFVVGQDGSIVQSVLLKDGAKHAHSRNNRSSIGVEHCARTPGELGTNDPGLPVSDVQYVASARLVAWLLMRCGLSPTPATIQGHAAADPDTTHRRCPEGCGWDWDRYMALVQQEYSTLQLCEGTG